MYISQSFVLDVNIHNLTSVYFVIFLYKILGEVRVAFSVLMLHQPKPNKNARIQGSF